MYLSPKMQEMIIEGEVDKKRLTIFLAIFIPLVIALVIFASIETKKLDARELNATITSAQVPQFIWTSEPARRNPKPNRSPSGFCTTPVIPKENL